MNLIKCIKALLSTNKKIEIEEIPVPVTTMLPKKKKYYAKKKK
jgi:hypothetical protein